jgi:hypothetical protein
LILTSYGKGAVILTTGRIHCKKDICHNLRQFDTNNASQKPDYRAGLPIARLRKIEDHVRAHLA